MIILATPARCVVLPRDVAAARRAALPAASAFVAPLAEAGEADALDLVCIADPRTPWPKQMRHTTGPTVLLIGDDPGGPDGLGGPDAWRCSSKLGGWAKSVMVHGAGGTEADYSAVAAAALLFGRVVLVEATSRHAAAWAERIGCPRTLVILPRTGPHPVAHRGTVH